MGAKIKHFSIVRRANNPSINVQYHDYWYMQHIHDWLISHQILVFFFITFLIAWLVWLLMIATSIEAR